MSVSAAVTLKQPAIRALGRSKTTPTTVLATIGKPISTSFYSQPHNNRLFHQIIITMSKEVCKIINQGSGPYQLTKEQAGEAYRAARKVKVDYVSYWSRRRGKASK